jgi:hypothetical protein
VRLPAVLVVTVYLTALAVALREPSEHLLAGAVLLLAVCARLALRPAARSAISHAFAGHAVRDRRSRRPDAVVLVEDAAPAVAPGTAA